MADAIGKYWLNVTAGTKAQQAPGHSNNAALRKNREVVALDAVGQVVAIGTTIIAGVIRGGDVLDYIDISANAAASLAGVSFAVGTRTNTTKYSAAVVGPAAGATVRIKFIDLNDLGLATVPFTSDEIVLTTSVGALPVTAGAKLQIDTYYSHK